MIFYVFTVIYVIVKFMLDWSIWSQAVLQNSMWPYPG